MRRSDKFNRERNEHRSGWKYAKWLTSGVVTIFFVTGILLASCSQQAGQSNSAKQRSGSADSQTSSTNNNEAGANSVTPGSSGNLPLRTLSDVPLTGGTTRLDYQSLDSDNRRLFIGQLRSDLMDVFDRNHDNVVCGSQRAKTKSRDA